MNKYTFIIIFTLFSCLGITAQEIKPYHIHNSNYEQFLTKDLIKTNFKKILKDPKKYQGKHINVKGFLVIDDSRFVLFKDENEYNNHLMGLKVEKYKLLLSKEEVDFLKDSCNKIVTNIYGTFDKNQKETDSYSGSFSNICIIPI